MRQTIVLKTFLIVAAMAAIGGAVVWGVAQSPEVRGSSEVAVQEAAAHVEGVPEMLADAVPEAGAVPSAQDLAEYLGHLRAEDYTTYTHPTLGYAFRYPKDFTLMTQLDPQEDIALLGHPRWPLGVRVTVLPMDPELFAYLSALHEDYDWEAPEGAESTAVRWLDEGTPYPGRWRGNVWFVHHGRLVEILMEAPDRDLVESWMGKFVRTDLTLTHSR
jgi:hypothetical protein